MDATGSETLSNLPNIHNDDSSTNRVIYWKYPVQNSINESQEVGDSEENEHYEVKVLDYNQDENMFEDESEKDQENSLVNQGRFDV